MNNISPGLPQQRGVMCHVWPGRVGLYSASALVPKGHQGGVASVPRHELRVTGVSCFQVSGEEQEEQEEERGGGGESLFASCTASQSYPPLAASKYCSRAQPKSRTSLTIAFTPASLRVPPLP